ncbi:unnamed protein product [Lathyrus oleraceus]
MADSTSTSNTTSTATSFNKKHKVKIRGVMIYIKVKKAHENSVHYPITVDVAIDRAYGENAEDFIDYIVLQGRIKVSILIDSWHDIGDGLKTTYGPILRRCLMLVQRIVW